MAQNILPLTERCNELSADLDGNLSAKDFLFTLRSCDAQVFSGYKSEPHILDTSILRAVEKSALNCSKLLADSTAPHNSIVMTGCGTSGRLAFLTSRRYRHMSTQVAPKLSCADAFKYTIAGGDSAILLSDEIPEDDPVQGAADVARAVAAAPTICSSNSSSIARRGGAYLIGVTCGLSAPYVAGQLAVAMDHLQQSSSYSSSSSSSSSSASSTTTTSNVTITAKGCAVIGFNPVSMSRDSQIESLQGKYSRFRDVATNLQRLCDTCAAGGAVAELMCPYSVINPIVGPEPVAGSSRMKGGSATLVLLDVICLRALSYAGASAVAGTFSSSTTSPSSTRKSPSKSTSSPPSKGESNSATGSPLNVAALSNEGSNISHTIFTAEMNAEWDLLSTKSTADLIMDFQRVHSLTYGMAGSTLPNLMHSAGESLHKGARLLYVGIGSAAIMGCIDASEMPDTYGSNFDQTRGFVAGGWARGFGNVEGDISHLSHLHRIGVDHFIQDIVPTLSVDDSVVFLLSMGTFEGISDVDMEEVCDAAVLCKNKGAKLSLIMTTVQPQSGTTETTKRIKLLESVSFSPENVAKVILPWRHNGFHDFSIKLMVNAVSTYAQALGRGALFKSLMISTGPANDKIYQRCVGLISNHVFVSPREAEVALIRSIYDIDDLHQAEQLLDSKPRIEHIRASVLPANKRHQTQVVLPVAFLVAFKPETTVREAKDRVALEPRVSVVLQEVLNACNSTNARKAGMDITSPPPPPPRMSPATTYRNATSESKDFVVGIDLGGTHVRAAAIEPCSGLFITEVYKLDVGKEIEDRSAESVLRMVGQVYCLVMETMTATRSASHVYAAQPIAVGIGQPGSVDEDGRISSLANYVNWTEPVDIRAYVMEMSKCNHVFVFDDADSALQAEVLFGAGRLCNTVAMLTIGTGIGTAVSIKGHIFKGSRGLIEGGHSIVDLQPSFSSDVGSTTSSSSELHQCCPCGQKGCLELFCSGSGIVRYANAVLPPNAAQFVTAEEVLAAAARPTAAADDTDGECESARGYRAKASKYAVDQAVQYLSVGCVNAIRAYDPDVLVLSGGLGKVLLGQVTAAFKTMHWHLHDDSRDIDIVAAQCEEPGVQGSAALAWLAYHQCQEQQLQLLQGSKVAQCDPVHATSACSTCHYTYLRKAKPKKDMEDLLRVCLLTGDAGSNGEHLFSDPRLLGHIYVAPYLLHSPDFAYCLDNGAGTGVGYVLGVLDTIAFTKTCEDLYWPQLREKYAISDLHKYWSNEQELIKQNIYRPKIILEEIVKEYPSHMHIDLISLVQGRGYGLVMVRRLLEDLRKAGSTGVHLTMAVNNARAWKFYTEKLNFKLLKELSATQELVLGVKL